jgi:hypothetical protein
MRILVTGGREFSGAAFLNRTLDLLHADQPITELVHGAALGADRLAGNWARSHGVLEIACPAEWARYGRSAGPRRNEAMLADHPPDLVVAFPGDLGSRHMVEIASEAGVTVIQIFDPDL